MHNVPAVLPSNSHMETSEAENIENEILLSAQIMTFQVMFCSSSRQ